MRGEHESGRELDRKVLEAVHREVERAVEQAGLELGGEEALAAEGGERPGVVSPRVMIGTSSTSTLESSSWSARATRPD